MSPPVPKTAMVFAAGLGTRMRPITETLPKPLVEIAGRPLLDHAIDRLAAAGVETVVVNTHYLAAQIAGHLAARPLQLHSQFGQHAPGQSFSFSYESQQQMLGADIVVAELTGFIIGQVNDPLGSGSQLHVLAQPAVASCDLALDLGTDAA